MDEGLFLTRVPALGSSLRPAVGASLFLGT